MSKRVGMEASLAISEAVKMANVDVVSAYPITPQTHIVESLSGIIADGELDAEFICVESEHTAMSACLGAAACGARTFTATAGQGLELMHEVVYAVSSMRLPVVMTVANRALSAPLSVWGDHSDAMAVRDTGWIQVFVENAQEAYDHVLWAYRVGEDRRALLPVMVHLDGFHVTHVVEPLELLEQAEADRYLPINSYPHPLLPDRPVTMGAYGPPFIYTEVKKSQDVALHSVRPVIQEGWKQFAEISGRRYQPVESYQMEGARVGILTMGSFGETASLAIDQMCKRGEKVGLLKLRLWRPFPFEEVRQAVEGLEILAVVDRCISFGGPGGPVCSEIRSALYQATSRPKVVGFVAGLGGRDISPEQFEGIAKRAEEVAEKGSPQEYEMIGVRE
ncbi:MAG: pyruvate ferredoxin oxidoreductase [Deltaproteobacteria bacterium]|nr:MAG: pyruvate ferredoxin oxidoreductase [Deltaproteobacteria bacterium]